MYRATPVVQIESVQLGMFGMFGIFGFKLIGCLHSEVSDVLLPNGGDVSRSSLP